MSGGSRAFRYGGYKYVVPPESSAPRKQIVYVEAKPHKRSKHRRHRRKKHHRSSRSRRHRYDDSSTSETSSSSTSAASLARRIRRKTVSVERRELIPQIRPPHASLPDDSYASDGSVARHRTSSLQRTDIPPWEKQSSSKKAPSGFGLPPQGKLALAARRRSASRESQPNVAKPVRRTKPTVTFARQLRSHALVRLPTSVTVPGLTPQVVPLQPQRFKTSQLYGVEAQLKTPAELRAEAKKASAKKQSTRKKTAKKKTKKSSSTIPPKSLKPKKRRGRKSASNVLPSGRLARTSRQSKAKENIKPQVAKENYPSFAPQKTTTSTRKRGRHAASFLGKSLLFPDSDSPAPPVVPRAVRAKKRMLSSTQHPASPFSFPE